MSQPIHDMDAVENESTYKYIYKTMVAYISQYKNLIKLVIILNIFTSYRYLIPTYDTRLHTLRYQYEIPLYNVCIYSVIRKFTQNIQNILTNPIEKHICTLFASYMNIVILFYIYDIVRIIFISTYYR